MIVAFRTNTPVQERGALEKPKLRFELKNLVSRALGLKNTGTSPKVRHIEKMERRFLDLLPAEIWELVIDQMPTKNRGEINDVIQKMRWFIKVDPEVTPCVFGSISAKKFAAWIDRKRIPFYLLELSEEDQRVLTPLITFLDLHVSDLHLRTPQKKFASLIRCAISLRELSLEPSQSWLVNELPNPGNLKNLTVRHGSPKQGVRFEEISNWPQFSHLKYLELQFVGSLSQESLKKLGSFLELEHLSLTGCRIESMSELHKLAHLTSLTLNQCSLSNHDLWILPYYLKLKSLSLDGNLNLTDKAFPFIASCHELQSVSLLDIAFTDNGLRHLKGLKYLSQLNLRLAAITGEGFADWSCIQSLSSLHLKACTNMTVEGVKKINQFTGLECLSLSFQDKSLDLLFQLTNLRALNLYASKSQESDFVYLQRFTKLNKLNLSKSRLTDVGLSSIAKCSSLEVLYVNQTAATDKGLKTLEVMPFLTEIHKDGGSPQMLRSLSLR